MIRTALYIALLLHFARKILRRIVPAHRSVKRRYLVLMGPYPDNDLSGYYCATVASVYDECLARRIAHDVNRCNGMSRGGPAAYVVSYDDLRVVDLATSFPEDRTSDMYKLEKMLPDMALWSIFGKHGSLKIVKGLLDKILEIAMRYGQNYESTDT